MDICSQSDEWVPSSIPPSASPAAAALLFSLSLSPSLESERGREKCVIQLYKSRRRITTTSDLPTFHGSPPFFPLFFHITAGPRFRSNGPWRNIPSFLMDIQAMFSEGPSCPYFTIVSICTPVCLIEKRDDKRGRMISPERPTAHSTT